MKNDFNVCPMCAGKKIKNLDNRKWICEDCGFDLYCNVAAAVGVIIYDDENNVLFEVRAKEPQKGKIAIPGGFVDFDETAENAVIRECKEELGLKSKILNLSAQIRIRINIKILNIKLVIYFLSLNFQNNLVLFRIL